MNLLRRLAAEHLRQDGTPTLPKYERVVSRILTSGRVEEKVEWNAQPRSVEWLESSSKDAPIARLALDNGIDAELTVTISDDAPGLRHSPTRLGLMTFWSTPPVDSDLCKEKYALQHLVRHGRFVWLYQPDVFGLERAALRRLRERADAEEAAAIERAKKQNSLFDHQRTQLVHPTQATNILGASSPDPAPAWAAYKKRTSSFFGHRFADGSAWVYFELESRGYGLRQLGADTGWQTRVPESVGTYRADLDLIVRAEAPTFRSRPVATRISGDLGDILQLMHENT
jgi:hypothetical protein